MPSGKDLALTFARAVVGTAALLNGLASTFNVWGGGRYAAAATDVAPAAVPPTALFYTVSIVLIVFGVLLLLGLWVRLAAWLVFAAVIAVGFSEARFGAYFYRRGGCEDLLALAALCVVTATHGPGAYRVEFKRDGEQ
jgi:uncharacterized membrane protein YphA (DoxX/SURF4 family)